MARAGHHAFTARARSSRSTDPTKPLNQLKPKHEAPTVANTSTKPVTQRPMQGDAMTDHTKLHRPSPPQNGELHCYLLYVYSVSPHACPRMRTDVYTRVLSDVYISVLSDVYMSDLCASLCVPFCALMRILACVSECVFVLELRRQILDTRRNTHICQWLNTHSLPPSLIPSLSLSRALSHLKGQSKVARQCRRPDTEAS